MSIYNYIYYAHIVYLFLFIRPMKTMSHVYVFVFAFVAFMLAGAGCAPTTKDGAMMEGDKMMKDGAMMEGDKMMKDGAMMEGDKMMKDGAMMEGDKMMKDGAMMEGDKMMKDGAMMEGDKMMKDGAMMEGDKMMKDDAMMMDNMSAGTYESYSAEKLAKADAGDVVLFFHAPWCPSCTAIDKAINGSLSSIPKGLAILKVDYDTNTDLRKKYGVTSQHTFVQVDSKGTLITKWTGGSDLASITSKVK